ncbi:MAG: hemolysin III family protein [Desulfohalobium sp.]
MTEGTPTPGCRYSSDEERANALTHGIGVVASCIGLMLLLNGTTFTGTPERAIGGLIFGVSLVLLYLASTLYHSLSSPRAKHIWRKLDHAAIFILIAGTYTPFMLLVVEGPLAWTILSLVWGLAIAGTVCTWCLIGRFKRLFLAVYIAMGWLCVLTIHEILHNTPTSAFICLVLGGLLYTGGTIFYGWSRLRFHHAIWHLFVLSGSLLHFLSVYQITGSGGLH